MLAATLRPSGWLTKVCIATIIALGAAALIASNAYALEDTITFEEYGEGTPITTQYEADGIIFSGLNPAEPPIVVWDGISETNPVLSGQPLFHGSIRAEFVTPGTPLPSAVNGLEIEVGFIDDPGSVQLTVETTTGPEYIVAEEYGFNYLVSYAENITGFTIEEVEYDEEGFEIDNVSFTPPAPLPPQPVSTAPTTPTAPPSSAPPSQPTQTPTPVTTSCSTYTVIDSRGSGENKKVHGHLIPEISPPGASFASRLRHLHQSSSLSLVKNPYPAVGLTGSWREILNGLGALLKFARVGAYHDSVVEGKKWLAHKIAKVVGSCAQTEIFLVGYSQGAQVTGDVIQKLHGGLLSHIRGVALFGDPYFNADDHRVDRGGYQHLYGLLGIRPLFTFRRVVSYCHKYDPICQGPLDYLTLAEHRFGPHEDYPPDATAAASYLNRFA